ncbi:MAG: SPL family radical SAM protein [Rhodothermales bacterium]
MTYRTASSLLTPGKGFMSAYDYTLNPYSGCTFGCTYCYAAFFARSREKVDGWGQWVTVKENALALLRKKRKGGTLRGKTIYLSSVTDPYQPVERTLELTRDLLKELAEFHQPRLVVQTRSPLVTRDLDVLARFERVQVNVTVTTDDDEVRRAFEPLCPNNRVRLKAVAEVVAANVPAVVTMTPLLPVRDPAAFAESLLATGAERFVVQPFHAAKGKFVAGTREEAIRASEALGWTDERYREVVRVLAARLPDLREGKDGFAPMP